MRKLIFGPFFVSSCAPALCCSEIVPLSLQLEWADPETAVSIPLFLRRPRISTFRVRLEYVLFELSRLPFDVECSPSQIVEIASGTFLPMDALLKELYTNYKVDRPIFASLAEMASLVPLPNPKGHKSVLSQLLVPDAENRGFLVTEVGRDRDRIYVEFGWRSVGQEYVFYAGTCAFDHASDGKLDSGHWIPHGAIGVAQLLSADLRRMARGTPYRLFNSGGRIFLKEGTKPIHLAAISF